MTAAYAVIMMTVMLMLMMMTVRACWAKYMNGIRRMFARERPFAFGCGYK